MKIYNQSKTEIIENPDLTKGYLIDDYLEKLVPATEPVAEESYYELIKEYPNGGRDVRRVVTKQGQAAQPAHIEKEEIKVYIPYTESELAAKKITYLKKLLANEDYKIIKCYEAQLKKLELPYDIDELTARRDSYRAEINELMTKLQ